MIDKQTPHSCSIGAHHLLPFKSAMSSCSRSSTIELHSFHFLASGIRIHNSWSIISDDDYASPPSGSTIMTALPKFSPVCTACKAFSAFWRPSNLCSRFLIFPWTMRGITSWSNVWKAFSESSPVRKRKP